MTDLWFVFALGCFVGVVGGIYLHIAYLEAGRLARWIVAVLRRLYGWHRARDGRRLDALEQEVREELRGGHFLGYSPVGLAAFKKAASLQEPR